MTDHSNFDVHPSIDNISHGGGSVPCPSLSSQVGKVNFDSFGKSKNVSVSSDEVLVPLFVSFEWTCLSLFICCIL